MKWEKIKNIIYLIIIFCCHILIFLVYLLFSTPINFYFVSSTLICGVLLFIFLSKRKKLITIISFILFLYLQLEDIFSSLCAMIEFDERELYQIILITVYRSLFMLVVIYFTITNFRFLKLLECFYLLIYSISLIDTFFSLSLEAILTMVPHIIWTFFWVFINLYLISNIKFSFVMFVKDELRVINKQKKKSIISDEEYAAKRKAIIDLI